MNLFPSSRRKHLLYAITALALLLFACRIPGFPDGSSVNMNVLLPEPTVGLDSLESYHAVYDLTLQGTLDGNLVDQHSRIEFSYVTRSNDEEVLWQEQQTGSSEIFLHSLRLGSAVYTRSQDGQDCWGEYNDQPVEAVPQPVSLLLPVTRSSKEGTETMNGVTTLHYHFTQDGLALDEEGISGEVWIAQEGGYVVKYTLSIPGLANSTGSGGVIEETLSYELTEINSIDQIELPADCVPVLVDIPTMADAQNLYRSSGLMDYTTPSETVRVINFYSQSLSALGWTLVEPLNPSDQPDSQTLHYKQGDQVLMILLDKAEGNLRVTAMLIIPSQASAEPTGIPSPTPGIRPTIDPSQSGLPADVPLYQGATDLQTLPTGASFSTSDPPDAVATFYQDHLLSLEWSLLYESRPDVSTIQQKWMKSNRILAIIIKAENGTSTIMLVQSNQQ